MGTYKVLGAARRNSEARQGRDAPAGRGIAGPRLAPRRCHCTRCSDSPLDQTGTATSAPDELARATNLRSAAVSSQGRSPGRISTGPSLTRPRFRAIAPAGPVPTALGRSSTSSTPAGLGPICPATSRRERTETTIRSASGRAASITRRRLVRPPIRARSLLRPNRSDRPPARTTTVSGPVGLVDAARDVFPPRFRAPRGARRSRAPRHEGPQVQRNPEMGLP